MTLFPAPPPVDAATVVEVGDGPEVLAAIGRPAVAAAIWRRQPLAGFQDWIDRLDPARLPSARLILRPGAVPQAVSQLCESAGTPGGRERDRLVGDVAALAHLFAELMRAPFLRLRLDAVATDGCGKFHADAVTARLTCTYRGAGTQYGVSIDGAEPQQVFTVPTGAPIVLRGALRRERGPARLLHRSPPIGGSGQTRLLLVLDPLHEMEAVA